MQSYADRYIAMPLDDPRTQGHAAASDAAAAVHGQRPSPPPLALAPAVTDRGKERKGRKHKYEDDAAAGAATAARSEVDGGATDGGASRHRRPRAPAASERTGAGSSKYENVSVRDERGGFNAVIYYYESAPVTATPAAVILGPRHRHQPAVGSSYSTGGGSSYYANDHAAATSSSSSRLIREPPALPHRYRPAKPHGAHSAVASDSAAADGVPAARAFGGGVSRYESPSVTARTRPNGIVIGGKDKYQANGSSSGGGSANADKYAPASSSSSRLIIREPAAPRHHHVPKPHKAHGAPSSSTSASAAQGEPDDDERRRRVGLEVLMKADAATRQSLVNEFMLDKVRQMQQAAGAVEKKRFSYRLTNDESDADLAAVYEKVEEDRRAAASGNGKRRRH